MVRGQIHYQLSVFLCAILPLLVYAWLGRKLHDRFEDPQEKFARRPMLLVGVTLMAACLAFSFNFAKWSKLKQAGTLLLAWLPALSGLLWESIYMQRPTIAIDSLLCTGLVFTWGLRKVSKDDPMGAGGAVGSTISEARFARWVSWAWSLSASMCLITSLFFAIDVNKKHPHEITFKLTPLQGFVVCGFVAVLAHNAAALASITEEKDCRKQEQAAVDIVERQVRLCCCWLAASGSIFSVVFTIHVKQEGEETKNNFRNELSGLALFITFVVACFLYRLYASVQSGKLPLPALPPWIVGILNSEWVRAVGLVLFLPLFPFVALLFIVRRRYRRRYHAGEDNESVDAMPLGDLHVLTRVSVVRHACLIVLLYISFVVFAQDLLDGVMAALDKVCDGMNFLSLSLTLVSSGLLLFSFPATTGAPLYVVAGRVCVKQFYGEALQKQFEEGTHAYRPSLRDGQCIKGMVVALVLCGIMKLGACYIEQKGFGEMLGKREWVRRAVGVHTKAIRATEGLLKGPKVLPKVCILLGGPDWPTSVLCGILQLPIGKILLLTSPAVLQGGGPSILVGACTFLATDARARCEERKEDCKRFEQEEQVFTELGGQALVVAAGMQFALAMFACKFIQEEYQSNKYDHERPEDRPLIELTRRREEASVKAWMEAQENAELRWVRISFMVSLVGLLVTAVLSALEVQLHVHGFWLVLGLLILSTLPFAVASKKVSRLLARASQDDDDGIQLQEMGSKEAS